mmetsp:Transcript_22282/g.48186  ORF Transcript_22282/g.48186 Transcript_22282/m.48186 type:complete len:168 (+) Transcript_22282:141-644(+)
MSSRLTTKLLRAVVASDEQQQHQRGAGNNNVSKRSSASKRKRRSSKQELSADNNSSKDASRIDPAQAQLHAILQFDNAIERYSSSGQRVLKRKNEGSDAASKRRKKVKQSIAGGAVGIGSARSSSAPRLKHEETFNKRRYLRDKEAKSLADLARMLKRSKKAKTSRA